MTRLAPFAALLLVACGGGPVAPEWQSQSYGAMEKFRQQYFDGDSKAAARSFTQAKSAIAATGKPELVAKVELYRCAIGVAALDFDACKDFEAMRTEASADDQAYGDFVDGTLKDAQAARGLPSRYLDVARARDDGTRNTAIAKIEDPVSRLVAAGASMRNAQLTPAGVKIAVDTASAHGWRRPLLAWLEAQAKQAEAGGDTVAAAAIRRRIELVYQSLPATRP